MKARILTQEKIEFTIFGFYWKLGVESQPLYKIYPKPKCFFDMKQNVGPISRSKKQCNQQLMSGWLKNPQGKASTKKRVGWERTVTKTVLIKFFHQGIELSKNLVIILLLSGKEVWVGF
jgi:hypothetical protein